MEWTDLDQAYLDIFGRHPDQLRMSVVRPTVADMGTIEGTECRHPDCDEVVIGFVEAAEAPNGVWYCPEHRR
jgi:hypothetical protein